MGPWLAYEFAYCVTVTVTVMLRTVTVTGHGHVPMHRVTKGAKKVVLGRRQVVRHRILVPTFKGSTPFAPEVSQRKVFLSV